MESVHICIHADFQHGSIGPLDYTTLLVLSDCNVVHFLNINYHFFPADLIFLTRELLKDLEFTHIVQYSIIYNHYNTNYKIPC